MVLVIRVIDKASPTTEHGIDLPSETATSGPKAGWPAGRQGV